MSCDKPSCKGIKTRMYGDKIFHEWYDEMHHMRFSAIHAFFIPFVFGKRNKAHVNEIVDQLFVAGWK